MQGCSPKPRRRRPCPTQKSWPHRRARRETLRHTVGRDGATRRGLIPENKKAPATTAASPWLACVVLALRRRGTFPTPLKDDAPKRHVWKIVDCDLVMFCVARDNSCDPMPVSLSRDLHAATLL